jgi:hypothetical protein
MLHATSSYKNYAPPQFHYFTFSRRGKTRLRIRVRIVLPMMDVMCVNRVAKCLSLSFAHIIWYDCKAYVLVNTTNRNVTLLCEKMAKD